ncbi:MAG: ribonuclease P protein component [Oscillospiraceae bacterium]|nr:ribonuclease P protein component [Oscillospiraceae bacterium]
MSLNKNKSFRYVYNRGISVVSPLLVTYVLKNQYRNNRIGITASKKIGNAVKRNRARRIIKAAYRDLRENINTGYDIIFVARVRTVNSNSKKIFFVMNQHLDKLGCLKRSLFNKQNHEKICNSFN